MLCCVGAEDARGKKEATSNTVPALYGKRHIVCPKNKHEADFRCDSKSKEAGSQKHVSQKLVSGLDDLIWGFGNVRRELMRVGQPGRDARILLWLLFKRSDWSVGAI